MGTQLAPAIRRPQHWTGGGSQCAANSRAAFETANVSVYIAEVNTLLAAVDTCLAAMV
jgi:hypothetical protein